MDNLSLILMTIFLLLMLALLIGAYIRQHKILKEMKKAEKANGDHLRKV